MAKQKKTTVKKKQEKRKAILTCKTRRNEDPRVDKDYEDHVDEVDKKMTYVE